MLIDILIAIFFFLVGLEIRNGLKDLRTAIVPIVAALGGMIAPALIFLALNPGSHVWATAMPTDIALALGVLSLLGRRVNVNVRLFLLTLAIADDLFSLIVLGAFYGDDLHPAKALSTLGAAAIGFILPLRAHQAAKVIKILTPVSTYLIVPIIIIVNIPFDIDLSSFGSKTTLSIVLARSIGKIIGITLFALIAVKVFRSELKISKFELVGGSALAGMGLAVSIMIANLSYTSEVLLNQAKVGLLWAALISAILGSLILIAGSRKVKE